MTETQHAGCQYVNSGISSGHTRDGSVSTRALPGRLNSQSINLAEILEGYTISIETLVTCIRRCALEGISSALHDFPIFKNRLSAHERFQIFVHGSTKISDELAIKTTSSASSSERCISGLTSVINLVPIGTRMLLHSLTNAFHVQKELSRIVFCFFHSSGFCCLALSACGPLSELMYEYDCCRGVRRS
jgi:hypothetical protein